MPEFEAMVRVTHSEVWIVEADNEDEARAKFDALNGDVETDGAGGEVIDWEVGKIKEVRR